MAFVPAMEVPRPPDQDGEQRNGEIHLLQQTSLSNSHHNSTNLESNTSITVPLSDDELKWAQEIISLAKSGVIWIVPIDGMKSTPHDPFIVVKLHNSLLPTERSAQANFEENSPKSPQNSNEDSSELRQFLEIQNTILESAQHSAPNHINFNYVNEGKDSDQVVGAQLNELTNANTHIPLPEGGVITSTTSHQSSSMNRLNTPSKAAGKSMWSPGFKPEEESPVVPIWVTLPELPWHCYYMDSLTIILSPIGKALYLDSASMQKTRGSVTKVRVQIDLTKERPQHIWIGFSEKDPSKGTCPLKIREEEIKKRKDMENNKKSDEK
ncbi:hypothetical protein KY285_030366 [Solanum tuberosum]|nr:hypothetical protein KY285_030366 [Solanum tuberosum]